MEAHDSHLRRCKDIMTQIIKGKRTKRQRLPSPLRLGMAGTSSSTASSSDGRTLTDGYDSGACDGDTTNSSLAASDDIRRSKEEEEDMANCLMLLAQGQQTQYHNRKVCRQTLTHEVISAAGIRNQGVAQNAYQCKTCEKSFSSFQSLGGHRASHRRPKTMSTDQETKQLPIVKLVNDQNDLHSDQSTTRTNLSLQILSSSNTNRQKVHECSLCGAVFSSGQALGGHMRRHRSVMINHTAAKSNGLVTSSHEKLESRKARSVLRLDLNLPAPEDDQREPKFNDQVRVFSATPLVDCYY